MLPEFVEWFKIQSKKRQFLIISALEEEFTIKAQDDIIKEQQLMIQKLNSYKSVIEENKRLRWKLKRHENKVY